MEVHDIIKDNINTYQIYCDYSPRPGYLFSLDETQDEELEQIIEGHRQVGLDTFEVDNNPFGIPSVRVVEIPNQAQFHPLKYLRILLKVFITIGGVFIENCRIISVDKEGDDIVATTTKGNIISKHLVYATHIPPGRNIMHFRNAPYRSYVMALKLRSGNYPDALGYDMFEPYHYYRSHNIDGQDYLIAGGEDHKTGDVDNTSDSFDPYIGHLPGNPDNVYCATGYSGNGMIFGTLAAKTLSDIISTGSSDYKIFSLPLV